MPPSSVKETNVGASLLPAMLSGQGRRDARARSGTSRASSCASAASEPWIVPVDRLGVPDYDELVLVANADKLDDQRDDLRLFISARSRGARARRARTRAARPRRCSTRTRDLKAKPTRESVRVTIPALFPRSGDQPWGYLDPVAVAQLRRLDGRQRRC